MVLISKPKCFRVLVKCMLTWSSLKYLSLPQRLYITATEMSLRSRSSLTTWQVGAHEAWRHCVTETLTGVLILRREQKRQLLKTYTTSYNEGNTPSNKSHYSCCCEIWNSPEAASVGEEASPFCLLRPLQHLRVPGAQKRLNELFGEYQLKKWMKILFRFQVTLTINTVWPWWRWLRSFKAKGHSMPKWPFMTSSRCPGTSWFHFRGDAY